MFESFEFLNRGWDVRALETVSLRKAVPVDVADVVRCGYECSFDPIEVGSSAEY